MLINIVTLGCAKNIVDSEHLAGQLAPEWQVVYDSDSTEAKVVIINTCGFILDAQEESINTILGFAQAKEQGRIDHLYVMGCLSERYADDLRGEIPQVDDFFGVHDFYDILERVGALYKPENETLRVLTTPPHYAYLKISEGCSWGCGYCAIPLIRGKHKSVEMDVLLREARELAGRGVKELIVIAQDTTYYGLDLYGERRLGTLLGELCKIEGLEWVRLHYAYPAQFPQDVLTAMREEPKICKYLDIPFQHIADNMLRSMRRGLDKAQTLALVDSLRAQVPDIALRTTMLVGYPGESQADFDELMDFVRTAKFERLGVFPYSEQEGTYSAINLPDDMPEDIKEQRVEQIMELQRDISLQSNHAKVGTLQRVIIDRQQDEFYVGRTQYDSPEVDGDCFVSSEQPLLPGTFVEVIITKADDYDLYGAAI